MTAGLALVGMLVAWGHPIAPPPDAGAPPPPEPSSIFGRDTALGPQPDGGTTPVRGSLDKEIIRRIIRRHINEVKACYEPELASQPLLGGRILVQFTIAATGWVVASRLQSSTMVNARVEKCTVEAVRGWQFPKPIGGGSVIVSYPFVLTPAGAQTPATWSIDVQIVGPGVVVHRSLDAAAGPANGLIVATDRGLLLVDTGWSEAQTEAFLRWGELTFGLPWIGAVITHDHPDRAGGIGALARRRIPVAALDLTVAKLSRRGVGSVSTLFAASAGSLDDARGFQAFYPGAGHATDNIVVAFPAQHVVFGGCLVKSAEAADLGFIKDADLRAWPAAIRRVADRYSGMMVIPGHGDVEGDALYRHTLDLLDAAAKKK